MCLFFSRKSQAQGALPVLLRNYSSLDSCVPYKRPPEKEEADRAVSAHTRLACTAPPSRRQAITPRSAGFRAGPGGAFTSCIHSLGKAGRYRTNLVSEKSGNLIALYSLVTDTFEGLIKINLDSSSKAGTMK